MTSGGNIWEVLGIVPTDDRRTIRSAYAVRLKAIDPEADPKAFVRLREAMDRALMLVDSRPAVAVDRHGAAGAGLDVAGPAELDPRFDLERETQTLSRMLFDGLQPGEADASLIQSLRRIWANPVAEHIETATQIEGWLAGIVAERLPLSDALIEPLIERYHWDKLDGTPDLDPRLSTILARRNDLSFIAAMSNPDGRHHAAFAMLSRRPETVGGKERRRSAPSLRALLRTMRLYYPSAEWHFGGELIDAWVDEIESPKGRRLGFIGIVRPAPVFPDSETATSGAPRKEKAPGFFFVLGGVALMAIVQAVAAMFGF